MPTPDEVLARHRALEWSTSTSERAYEVLEELAAANGVTVGSILNAWSQWVELKAKAYGWDVAAWEGAQGQQQVIEQARLLDDELQRALFPGVTVTPPR